MVALRQRKIGEPETQKEHEGLQAFSNTLITRANETHTLNEFFTQILSTVTASPLPTDVKNLIATTFHDVWVVLDKRGIRPDTNLNNEEYCTELVSASEIAVRNIWNPKTELQNIHKVEGREFSRICKEAEKAGSRKFNFPGEKFLIKGNIARHLVKIATGASEKLKTADSNVGDTDVIIPASEARNRARIAKMLEANKADTSSIEIVLDTENKGEIFALRDMDMNQCILDTAGLYFTEAAKKAAETGVIHLTGNSRFLIGSDTKKIDGLEVPRSRLMYRGVKMIVEGKAHTLEIPRLHTRVKLENNVFTLLRKIMSEHSQEKEVKLKRMFVILQKLEQTASSDINEFFAQFIKTANEKTSSPGKEKISDGRVVLTQLIRLVQDSIKDVLNIHSGDWMKVVAGHETMMDTIRIECSDEEISEISLDPKIVEHLKMFA